MSKLEDPHTVLVVDDVPDNIDLLVHVLSPHYRTLVAVNGEMALKIASSDPKPDLILLDVVMPGMNGYEVCNRLKMRQDTKDTPVIFVTSMDEVEDERKGLELGAADYITKPINPSIVLARVRTHLNLKASADFLRDKSIFLENEIVKRTREVQAIQDVTIMVMASLAETRDPETGNHIRRTQYYVRALAKKLQEHPRYAAHLSDREIDMLYKSAPLHDIGKVGIPDKILLKPGSFNKKEFEVMKTHTTLGRDAIEHAEKTLHLHADFLGLSKEIAYGHQEKWDGSGYPEGIVGEEIPISARLMAIADVYDALISSRPYKEPFSHEEAVKIMSEGRGTHFDPDILDAFLEIQEEFKEISEQFPDAVAYDEHVDIKQMM